MYEPLYWVCPPSRLQNSLAHLLSVLMPSSRTVTWGALHPRSLLVWTNDAISDAWSHKVDSSGKFITLYQHRAKHSNPKPGSETFGKLFFILCASFSTLAFSMTLANSPLHMKQCFGVIRRKQSPLFREWAVGSIKRTWTCLRPTDGDKAA